MNIKKKDAVDFGKHAEDLVAHEYVKKGYTILERRYRLGKSEIDLIAQRDNEVIFIEVKGRSGKDEDALSAVTPDKRKRMVKVADYFLKRLPGVCDYRFDIATVIGNSEKYVMEIYEDAFVAADLF